MSREDHEFLVMDDGAIRPVIAGGGGRSGGGGGTTTVTSTVNVPPPSAEERALHQKQVELLDLQVQEARRQSKLLEESFPQSQALLKQQLDLTTELAAFQRRSIERQEKLETALLTSLEKPEAQETAQQKEIRELSEKRAISLLRGEAPALSTQHEGFINEQFAAAEKEAKTSLRQFAEELAASRGLRLTDAPIGAEVLRSAEALGTGLAGAKAKAKLDVSQTQQAFTESVRQFQEGLRQQAFLNRLALTGRESPGLALGVGGVPSLLLNAPRVAEAGISGLSPLLAGMRQERFAAAPTTQTSVSRLRGGGVGFGDVAGPFATLGSAAILASSSARFKADIEPLDRDEYERARRKVQKTPVVRFRYKWEGRDEPKHLGILIETSPEEVSRDGLTLDVPGYLGLTLAAVKGVDRRIDRLERGLRLAEVA